MPTYPIELPTGSARHTYVTIPPVTPEQPGVMKNAFFLHTTTPAGGPAVAVSTPLGLSTLRTAWTILIKLASITTSGEVRYRGSLAQLVFASDGAGTLGALSIVTIGTPVNVGFSGDGGKMTPSVTISGGKVLLVFTPVADDDLPVAFGVSGTITGAVAQ